VGTATSELYPIWWAAEFTEVHSEARCLRNPFHPPSHFHPLIRDLNTQW